MAEFERDLAQERTKSGLDAARAHGRRIGRPTVMTDERSQQARRMHDEGYRVTQLARVLGVSRGTIYRRLG